MCLSCPARLQIRNIDFLHRRSVAVKSRWETLLLGIFFCASVQSLLLQSHPRSFLHGLEATSWTFFFFFCSCIFFRRAAANTDGGDTRLWRARSVGEDSGTTEQQLDWVQLIHLAKLPRAAFPVGLGTSLSVGFRKERLKKKCLKWYGFKNFGSTKRREYTRKNTEGQRQKVKMKCYKMSRNGCWFWESLQKAFRKCRLVKRRLVKTQKKCNSKMVLQMFRKAAYSHKYIMCKTFLLHI